jgi:L-2-hydroxyglutarate oxidase LhgO
LPSRGRSQRPGGKLSSSKARGIGSGVSSHNSEVIHAGIYYPTELDETRLCFEGKAMLYAFCREFGVPNKRCGKLLVVVNEGEVDKLAALKTWADANGVVDLTWLNGKEARATRPCSRGAPLAV